MIGGNIKSIFARGVGIASGFLINILLVNSLGQAGFGLYSGILSAMNVVVVPLSLSLSLFTQSEIVNSSAVRARVILDNRFKFVLGLVICLVVLIIFHTVSRPLEFTGRRMAFISILYTAVLIFNGFLTGILKAQDKGVVTQIGDFVLRPISFLFFLWIFHEYIYVGNALIFLGFSLLPAMIFYVKHFGLQEGNRVLKLKLNKKVVTFYLNALVNVFGTELFFLLALYSYGENFLSEFKIVFTLFNLSLLPVMVIDAVSAPKIAGLLNLGKNQEARILLVKNFKFVIIMGVLTVLSILFTIDYILPILYPKVSFENLSTLKFLFSTVSFVGLLSASSSQLLQLMGKPKLVLKWQLLALLGSLLLFISTSFLDNWFITLGLSQIVFVVVWRLGTLYNFIVIWKQN